MSYDGPAIDVIAKNLEKDKSEMTEDDAFCGIFFFLIAIFIGVFLIVKQPNNQSDFFTGIGILLFGIVIEIYFIKKYNEFKELEKKKKENLKEMRESYEKAVSQDGRLDDVESKMQILKSIPGMDEYIRNRLENIDIPKGKKCPYCEKIFYKANIFNEMVPGVIFCPHCNKTIVNIEKKPENVIEDYKQFLEDDFLF